MGILLVSCESEYQRQLSEAKNLVEQELRLRESVRPTAEMLGDSHYLLEELQKEIVFKAHLSGNEEAFLHELGSYKERLLAKDPTDNELLLSKYP
jgi:hypothetical protein